MTEQQIQSKRIKQLEQAGYYVIKLIKTNKNGIPDLVGCRNFKSSDSRNLLSMGYARRCIME
jgi:hypothetical protein